MSSIADRYRLLHNGKLNNEHERQITLELEIVVARGAGDWLLRGEGSHYCISVCDKLLAGPCAH